MLKRRRNKRTDYKKRLGMLKSGKIRLVVRRHGMNVHAQLVEYTEDGDKTILEEISKNLAKYGWKGHNANLPASYLLGFLIGLKAVKKGISEAILDVGLQASTRQNAIYALVKGANDAGLKVPVGEEILPSKERISGKHIADYAAKLRVENPVVYQKQFSAYLKNDVKPEDISKHFEDVKHRISTEVK